MKLPCLLGGRRSATSENIPTVSFIYDDSV
jgi:hypothetical protein